MNYRFHNAEKGVMYEIMLPKKIQYQDFLFTSLVNGFRTFTFTGYFQKNRESVRQLFENYSDVLYLKRNNLECSTPITSRFSRGIPCTRSTAFSATTTA
jgi:hypothetical protein